MASMLRTFPIALVAFAALSCCGQRVGYDGPIPSSEARRTLAALWGETLPAGSVAFTDKAVALRSFLVGPHAPTVIVDERPVPPGGLPPLSHRVPVFTDGDIGDLHRRATGSVPAQPGTLGGELSDGYRRKMTGR